MFRIGKTLKDIQNQGFVDKIWKLGDQEHGSE